MKKYNLAEIIEREGKKKPLLSMDIGDGKSITIPQRALWPDAALTAAQNEDIVAAARALAGDNYDAFLEAGGTAVLLWEAITDSLGADNPESKASTDS
jgi:hypothetical protein